MAGMPMRNMIWMAVTAASLAGCAAGRGTYFLAEADRHVQAALDAEAPEKAIYAWTMADEARRKAWEEWGYSDYEEAERLAKLAAEWADKAEKLARSGSAVQFLGQPGPGGARLPKTDSDAGGAGLPEAPDEPAAEEAQ